MATATTPTTTDLTAFLAEATCAVAPTVTVTTDGYQVTWSTASPECTDCDADEVMSDFGYHPTLSWVENGSRVVVYTRR